MSIKEKARFLRTTSFESINQLAVAKQPHWGKMSAQQMLEHLNDFYEISIQKWVFELAVPEAHLPKYKAFLYSPQPFRENTKAPKTVLGDHPLPLRTASLDAAKAQLQLTVEEFFHFFETQPNKTTTHPVFGSLHFEEWVLLHYKHVSHHLRQFE